MTETLWGKPAPNMEPGWKPAVKHPSTMTAAARDVIENALRLVEAQGTDQAPAALHALTLACWKYRVGNPKVSQGELPGVRPGELF